MLGAWDAFAGHRLGFGNRGSSVARKDRRYLSAAVMVALVAAVGLSACGRKGPLEPPPGAAAAVAAPIDPTLAGAPPPPPPPDKPDKPFFLDPLLD